MTATRPLASPSPKATPRPSVLKPSVLKPSVVTAAGLTSLRSKATAALSPEARETLLQQSSRLDDQARGAAERGDTAAAAQLILEALDCERRAGSLGPQVLQLIKPRG